MKLVSSNNNKPWFFSEVWIFGEKPITQDKLEKQARLFQAFFDFIKTELLGRDARFKGLGVRFWNQYKEDMFCHVINTPSELVVKQFFETQE